MLHEIEKKLVRVHLALLAIFAWGLGFLYLVSTVLFNAVQLRWELFCFTWEAAAFGLPLIVFRPIFRPIRRWVRELESGRVPSAAEATRLEAGILSYPFKVASVVFLCSVGAYGLGVLQMRTFAHLPWEGLIITMVAGLASALLWAVLEYFLLEYYLRPLTGLVAAIGSPRPPRQRISLAAKIFACSVALVIAAVSFFGIAAYSRATRVVEQDAGSYLTERMREAANLIGGLPRSSDGSISDAWRFVAAEFRFSPRGYFLIVAPSGDVIATHPASAAWRAATLDEVGLLDDVRERVLALPEGYVTDRVENSKIVSFVGIPGTAWKIVAIAPLHDLNPQLDQLLYAGASSMGFAVLLCLGIGFICARTITTSLGEVTRAALAVAERRDLGQRVRFVTNDEVGVLARAFDQMADELQTYAQGLERRVAERTEQLRHRTEQLEAKNAELSDFLYVASHDLRSPLINLDGFSRALRDSVEQLDRMLEEQRARSNGTFPAALTERWPDLKEEIGESLDFILRSTAKMDFLVRALLDLSRIDARATARQEVDTAKIVDEIRAAFSFQLAEKGIALRAGPLPVVVGDPVRLNQVFTNLIDNAIKYMPEKEGAVIELGCETTNTQHHFFVRDNGAGIRREDQEKVFRLFTRLSTDVVTGDGVGLTAVRKIVDKHGGRIWIDSDPGEGSTFWFTLPRGEGGEVSALGLSRPACGSR